MIFRASIFWGLLLIGLTGFSMWSPASDGDDVPQKNRAISIAEIQGSPATQGPNGASPFVGQSLSADGIVAALTGDGFFIQMPDPGDSDLDTSDGIFVYMGGAPTVALGDAVSVTGQIQEYYGMTEIGSNPVVLVNSSGSPIPSARELDVNFPDPKGSTIQLEAVEGMLVSLPHAWVVTPGTTYHGKHFYATTLVCHVL